MSEVKRYTPVVNGASFIGMAEIGRDGYWAGPDVGPFVPSSDYDALAAELEKAVNNARANWIDAEQQAARVRELEADMRLCRGDATVAKFRMLSAERDDMLDKLIAAKARIAALEVDCNIMCNALQRIEAGETEPRMIARRTLEHWSEKAALATADRGGEL